MLKRADLHLHTRFSEWKRLRVIQPRECYSDPLDAYRRCKDRGMDFVAFTDHDTIDGALDLLSRRPDLEPEIIVGEEVETRFPDTGLRLHVNVFDIDESIHADVARLRPNVFDLVAYLRERRVFHVLNHPFWGYRLQEGAGAYVEEILRLFDHFEVGNATQPARHNVAVAEMLDYASAFSGRKHGVGGSDAHNLGNIARCWTEAPVPDAGRRAGKLEFLAAVARGEGRAAGSTIGAVALMADVYRIIGRYYLSLGEPEMRRTMRARNYLAAAALAPASLAGVPAFFSLGMSLRIETTTLLIRRALRELRREREARALQVPGLTEPSLD